MPIPISYSNTPLVLDAISAVKVVHYYGSSAAGNIYAYLRAYVCAGELIFSLTSFEKTPPKTSRVGAAFQFAPGANYLFAGIGPEQVECRTVHPARGQDTPGEVLLLPPPARFGGADEQGFYWGAELRLPAALLQARFGTTLRPGSRFAGNAYKYAVGDAAFGAAFTCEPQAGLPSCQSFGDFVVVDY